MLANYDAGVSSSVNTNLEGSKRKRISDPTDNDSEKLGPGTSSDVREPCLSNDLALMLDSSSEDECEDSTENCGTDAILKKELLNYRTKKRVNVNENPLKWWDVHRQEFKILSPIVRRFLSTPPGSVPSEQLFSSAGLIYEPLRNRLESEKAAVLLFIKYNAPIFNFNY